MTALSCKLRACCLPFSLLVKPNLQHDQGLVSRLQLDILDERLGGLPEVYILVDNNLTCGVWGFVSVQHRAPSQTIAFPVLVCWLSLTCSIMLLS